MKDLISGTKKYIHSTNMKHLAVPQYEGLSIDNILEKAGPNAEFKRHLPINQELIKLPKQWIVNVAYTLLGDPFANWVMQQIEARNQKVYTDHNLLINVDPDIMAAF